MRPERLPVVAKVRTGIDGLDDITNGGLPRGRPTLVYGSAGCGKTLFGIEFLARGAEQGESGVFVSFEETEEELLQNSAQIHPLLLEHVARRRILFDYVHVDRSEIEETGEYDLEGLFVRLGAAIDAVKARRVVLDSVETLFSGLSNAAILRAELKRLFRWLKTKQVSAIITGEAGVDGRLTRHGLEEYVSDCVILLDHRIGEESATRKLRVVKYRGSPHGTNAYPFLIDANGRLSVQPITSLRIKYAVSEERVTTGTAGLDAMLGGKGFFRGSTVLVSGAAGTGKTTLSAAFANATCAAGERCLYLAFEESTEQLVRNMRSVGLDLARWTKKGLLRIQASRPSLHGLEMHLVSVQRMIEEHRPSAIVVDPISNLISAGTLAETRSMLTRLVDMVKTGGITGFFTSLTPGGRPLEKTEEEISSLIDSWIVVRDADVGGQRTRTLAIVKSRGMTHSNQTREFVLGARGVEILEPRRGPRGFVTGTARLLLEERLEQQRRAREQAYEQLRTQLGRNRAALEAQIAAMRAAHEAQEAELLARGLGGEPGEEDDGPARGRGEPPGIDGAGDRLEETEPRRRRRRAEAS